jgi:hypothetical protein
MKSFDQGHLHPKLKQLETDMSRPGIGPKPPRWEASTLEKSNSNSTFKGPRNRFPAWRNRFLGLDS